MFIYWNICIILEVTVHIHIVPAWICICVASVAHLDLLREQTSFQSMCYTSLGNSAHSLLSKVMSGCLLELQPPFQHAIYIRQLPTNWDKYEYWPFNIAYCLLHCFNVTTVCISIHKYSRCYFIYTIPWSNICREHPLQKPYLRYQYDGRDWMETQIV